MRIKSYFASSVEDAMAMARQELGPEAMLVNSRRAPLEARHLGDYEVVFAAEKLPGQAASAASVPASSPVAQKPVADRLSAQVADLRRELEGMRRAIGRSAFPASNGRANSNELSDAFALLTANEVSHDLAEEIVRGAEERLAAYRPEVVSGADFRRVLVEELESRVTVEPLLGRGEARPRIVALVGPPGAGKTTTLVKLAVNYGLAGRRPVLLLSTDTYRVAAAEQLRSYATILGVGFQVLETVAALAQAIEENRGKELVFVDTPGMAFSDLAEFSSLAQFLATQSDIDTQLVVSSSMKPGDLARVVDGFDLFRPRRLIFTRLDETSSFGPILNELVRTGKALSFFTNGQRIPEDLEAASGGRLAELVLGGDGNQVLSAA